MSDTKLAEPPAPAADPTLPGRWLSAFLAWDALRGQLPDQPATYLAFVTALRNAGQPVQAETVLGEAARRFYSNPDLAVEHAKAAEQREDWPIALARWEHVRALFPLLPAAHVRVGALLRQKLGRPDEGDQVLEAAAARFPNRPEVWTEYAAAGADRKDRPAAIGRYQTVRDRFPTIVAAWRASAQLLREERRFDDADAVVAEGLVRFPDDAALMLESAWIAHQRPDWDTAAARWAAVRLRHAERPVAHWMGAAVLINALNRLDEAEDLLGEATVLFPAHEDMAIDHARLAERRGDLMEAKRRWDALVERFPENAAIAAHAARVAAAG